MEGLEAFIVRAKAACYVGGGAKTRPSREGSHDLAFEEGDWSYLDSYFGGTDFLGQEVVWHRRVPVWAMSYYGHILRPDLTDADQTGEVIKAALSELYAEGRFLGGYRKTLGDVTYEDRSTGSVTRFHGVEVISVAGVLAYQLDYFGGLIKA